MTTYNTTGTIAVTNGSATVTGTSTNWDAAGIVSGTLYVEGAAYPVLSVQSDTSLTLAIPYAGTTGTGKAYAISVEQQIIAATVSNANRLAVILDNLTPLSEGVVPFTNAANVYDALQTFARTDAVAALFQRAGGATNAVVGFKTTAATIYAGNPGNGYAVAPSANLASDTWMYINSSGRVGFGTQTPVTSMEVKAETGGAASASMQVADGDGRAVRLVSPNDTTPYAQITTFGTSGDLRIGTRDYPSAIIVDGGTGEVSMSPAGLDLMQLTSI